MLKSILQAFAKFKGVLPQNWYQNVIANIDNTSRNFNNHINKSTDYPSDHQNSIELALNSQGNAGMLYPASNQENIGAIFTVPNVFYNGTEYYDGVFRIFKGLNTIAFTVGLKLDFPTYKQFMGFKSLIRDSTTGAAPSLYFAFSNYNLDDPSSDGTNVNPGGVVPTLGIIRSDGTRLPLWYDYIKSAVRLYYIVSSTNTITYGNRVQGYAPDVRWIECLNVPPPNQTFARQFLDTYGNLQPYNGYATSQAITIQSGPQSAPDLSVYFPNGPLDNITLVYGVLMNQLSSNQWPLFIYKNGVLWASFVALYPYIMVALNNSIVDVDHCNISINGRFCSFPAGDGTQSGDVFFATDHRLLGTNYNSYYGGQYDGNLVSRILVASGDASSVMTGQLQTSVYQSYIGLSLNDITVTTGSTSFPYNIINSVKFTNIGWVEVNLLWVPKS